MSQIILVPIVLGRICLWVRVYWRKPEKLNLSGLMNPLNAFSKVHAFFF
jgi:hypothetical protein